jgi:hypothetical protein
MKTFLLLAFVMLLALILVNRQRVYVRDPLATVYRNDIKQSGVQVFINYSNDVLIEQDAQPAYRTLVQEWNKMPGTPVMLRCLRWMACLADADHATTYPLGWNGDHAPSYPIDRKHIGRYDPRVAMTSRAVSFVDGDGATVRVKLR